MENRKDIALIWAIQIMKISLPDAAVIRFSVEICIISLSLKNIHVSQASEQCLPECLWSAFQFAFTAVSLITF